MVNESKANKTAAREARLRKALRENLKRRKAQARERSSEQESTNPSRESHDSAGIAMDNRKG
jgi:hypothetical protein